MAWVWFGHSDLEVLELAELKDRKQLDGVSSGPSREGGVQVLVLVRQEEKGGWGTRRP